MMLRTNKDAMRRSRQQMWFQECGRQATSPETVRAIVEQWAEGLGIPPSGECECCLALLEYLARAPSLSPFPFVCLFVLCLSQSS